MESTETVSTSVLLSVAGPHRPAARPRTDSLERIAQTTTPSSFPSGPTTCAFLVPVLKKKNLLLTRSFKGPHRHALLLLGARPADARPEPRYLLGWCVAFLAHFSLGTVERAPNGKLTQACGLQETARAARSSTTPPACPFRSRIRPRSRTTTTTSAT